MYTVPTQGLAAMPDPRALGLASMHAQERWIWQLCQTQATWVWGPCQTQELFK